MWSHLADGVDGPVDFHAMTVSPADPKIVYGLSGGIQLSRDGGVTWEITGPGPADTIDLAAAPDDPAKLYAGTIDGLMVSSDFGAPERHPDQVKLVLRYARQLSPIRSAADDQDVDRGAQLAAATSLATRSARVWGSVLVSALHCD